MTIKEAIKEIDTIRKNNQVSEELKIKWLSMLDARVWREIILEHKGVEPGTEDFQGYDVGTSQEQELLVPFPYDELYRYFLEMKLDEAQRESLHYNISAEKFNTVYQAYMDRYNRTHTPVYGGNQFYF